MAASLPRAAIPAHRPPHPRWNSLGVGGPWVLAGWVVIIIMGWCPHPRAALWSRGPLPANGGTREDGKQCPHRWGSAGQHCNCAHHKSSPVSPRPRAPKLTPSAARGWHPRKRTRRWTKPTLRRSEGRMAAYMGQWVGSLPTSLVSSEWDIKLLFIASYGRYGQLTSDNRQSLAVTIWFLGDKAGCG